MPASQRFALVAGETSGDLLAGLLLGGMRQRWPDQRSYGIGGARMAEQGFDAWWPSERLAVRGYIEVLRHYRGIVSIRNQLRERLLGPERPDVFIGVDAPDFNLDLEADLKGQGIRTVHFVCPSIWAWRPERVEKIRRSADHVLCIFPFEPALLAQHGICVHLCGPSAGRCDSDAARPRCSTLGVGFAARRRGGGGAAGQPQFRAAIPGVSVFLTRRHAFVAARPGTRFVVPAVPALQQRIAELAQTSGLGSSVQVLAGQSHTALAACDVTLIASGTATLEAALFKRPMVIAYNMNCAVLADHAAQAAAALGRSAQHPVSGVRGARAAAGLPPPRRRWRKRCSTGWMRLRESAPCSSVSRRCTTHCAATPPNGPPMRSRKFLAVKQASLVWDVPGLIAGVDEAGRGPLAGPVVAAAVMLDERFPIRGLADSKQLSPRRREHLYDEIRAKALCCSIAQASVEEIDRLNILQATLLAMQRAVKGLRLKPTKVLVDGNRLPSLDVLAEAVVSGDSLVPAISAASIIAKVTRDRLLDDLHALHPGYGFDRHKGYGTAQHLQALQALGPLDVHRRSFAPVARALQRQADAA